MDSPLRVLIIEDSEDDALLLLRELRKGGYKPIFERVYTPEAMENALARDTWDVVISDYVMPRFSGLDALSLLHTSGLDLPFIIVSGKIGEDIAVEAMRAGAHDYFLKGNLARLIPAIERELRETKVRYERRVGEEKLRRAHEELERMVVERTAELVTANEELKAELMERKRIEEELRENQDLLHAVFSGTNDAIFVKDRDCRIIMANPATLLIFGKNAQEVLGKNDEEIYENPEIGRSTMENDYRIMESGYSEIVEEIIEGPQGRQVFLSTKTPRIDAEGRIIGIIGVACNITDRKQAEDAIIQHNAILEGFNRILSAAITCDTEEELGRICLEVAERITLSKFGFIAEIKGKGLVDIAISNSGWDACKIIQARGNRPPIQSFAIHGIYGRVIFDGKSLFSNDPAHHPAHIGIPPGHLQLDSFLGVPLIRQGNTIGMIAVGNREGGYTPEQQESLDALAPAIVEAFQRKRAEEELNKNRKQLQSILDNTPSIVFIKDMVGRYILFNRQWEKLFNPKGTKLHDKTDYEIFPPELAEKLHANDLLVINSRTSIDFEESVHLSDGTLHTYLSTKSPIFDDSGKIFAICGISTDITGRKRGEEALQKAHDELELRVNDRTAQLKESLDEKEILLREIHHRVKNNMQVISGLLMLQEEFSNDKKVSEMIRESQNRIDSMALIHEKLYRSESLSKIDFKEYVDELVNGLFESYGITESKVRLRVDAENIFMGIDLAIPCGLIINELVSNSLKHAFPADKNGEIEISLISTGEDMIELKVRDNGVGIPEGIDFRKTESLGLHIVNILVENQLHGEIKMNKNKGTEFRIKFRGMK